MLRLSLPDACYRGGALLLLHAAMNASRGSDDTEVILQKGAHVFGRYALTEWVGKGAMGVVWRARDESLGREVALKFLPDHVRRDPKAIRDLKRETNRCLTLTHANIVRVHTFEEDAHATAIVMEYVPGRSLLAIQTARPGGCLDAADLAPLVPQLCAALDCAHLQAKIVHRDLKPGNLLVTGDGVLKVVDFGISRSLEDTHTRQTADLRGTSGTLGYMSPQQLDGGKDEPAHDIYALGATLYDLLTGEPPFHKGDIMGQIRTAAPAPLAARRADLGNTGAPIPREWETTILACLAKEAAERPRSAGEVAQRLGLAAGDATVRFAPPGDATVRITVPASAPEHDAVLPPSPSPGRTNQPALDPEGRSLLAGDSSVRSSAPRQTLGPESLDRLGTLSSSNGPAEQASRLLPRARRTPWLGLAGAAALAVVLAVIFWPKGDSVRPNPVGPALGPPSVALGEKRVAGPQKASDPGADVTPPAAPAMKPTDDLPPQPSLEATADRLSGGPAANAPVLPREFTVTVDPPEAAAHLWLGPQANVAINDGKALLKDLPDGEHELVVEAPGYQPLTTLVTVKDGRGSAEAKLVTAKGGLDFRFSMGDFRMEAPKVLIDGKAVEVGRVVPNAPVRIEGLEVGVRAVEITHSDYEPWQQSVTVRDQQLTAVEVKLQPKPGRLTVRAEPREIVLTINGHAVRPDEFKNGETVVPAGEALALVASAKGFKSAARTLTLPANGRHTWKVALERQPFPVTGESWENTLGMKFVPGPAREVLFSAWDTRVQDYEKFASATRREWLKPGYTQSPTHPAVNVSWEDAQAFCEWLTKKEQAEGRLGPGQKYRLPTDAEWSAAVQLNESRGGTPKSKNGEVKGIYPWGTQWPPPRGAGNYADETARRTAHSNWKIIAGYDDGFANTSPVGSFAANRHGLYDLGGNVWQWCEDYYDGSGGRRVLRGASFIDGGIDLLLSSFRGGNVPGFRGDGVGFRCVIAVGGASAR